MEFDVDGITANRGLLDDDFLCFHVAHIVDAQVTNTECN